MVAVKDWDAAARNSALTFRGRSVKVQEISRGRSRAGLTLSTGRRGQICEQLKDPMRNGARDIPTILHHVVSDTLVMWAWSPGSNRTPAPGTNAQFGELLRGWAEAGTYCPPP
jgi:hypothetical protein